MRLLRGFAAMLAVVVIPASVRAQLDWELCFVMSDRVDVGEP